MSKDLVNSIPANIGNTLQIDLYIEDTKDTKGIKKARSYAGHIDINSMDPGRMNHLFYWFFESQTCNPHVAIDDPVQKKLISETPLIIWLNGGPGASSLVGLFLENGPFTIGDDAAGTISVTPDSWNQEAHVVYWDQPIGTGYSYADPAGEYDPTKVEYVRNEEDLSQMFWEGLQGFFTRHPEYKDCPLYLCGESYAGKYVPAIALKIDEKNRNLEDPQIRIDLNGTSVGNGWIRPELSIRITIDYAYATGFIGIDQKNQLYKFYDDFKKALSEGKLEDATRLGNALVNATLGCGGGFDLYDARRWEDPSMGALSSYLDSKDVKKALHVPELVTWQCQDNAGPVAQSLVKDIMRDCSESFTKLLKAKNDVGYRYKLLFYTGNFDLACGYQSTEEILDDLEKWEDTEDDPWRTAPRWIWTQAQGNPKGFVRQYLNLTQVSVPDSGHLVPIFQPQTCREMIYNWIFDRPFLGGYIYTPKVDDSQGGRFSRWKHSPRRDR